MGSADADLLREALRDDAAAARLVARLQPLLGRIARARAGDGAEADDIVAESLARIILRAEQYQARIPLEHWAARIAVNLACDRARARARRPQVELSAELCEPAESTARRHEAGRAREEVERLLAWLDPADRMVVVLLDLEGRSTAEISALTGWSRTAIKVRAFRARRKLRRLAVAQERSTP